MDFDRIMDRVDRLVEDPRNYDSGERAEASLRYIESALRLVRADPAYTGDAVLMLEEARDKIAFGFMDGFSKTLENMNIHFPKWQRQSANV